MTESNNLALSGKVLPTFFYYTAASMAGLVALTTTSLVDGVFVGNYVGGHALAAVTLLVPCFTLAFAIALMFAIGGSVAAGKHVGAGDLSSAADVFSQTLIGTVVTATALALASLWFEEPLFRLLDVPPDLTPLVGEYFGVIRWVLVLQLTTMVLYYFVRADGHPMLATAALVVGSCCNIALDALFVVRLELGLSGAAYATALAQVLQCGVLCLYFLSPSRTLRFVPSQRRWSHLVGASYNGLSEFINEASVGVVLWLLNHLLIARLGVTGVAAFSVVNYFIYLSLMLGYGIADTLHLVVSQNFGAGDKRRVQSFSITALVSSLGLGGLLATVIFVWREPLTGWFLGPGDAEVAQQAIQLVHVLWPLFLVNVTNVILSCYLTAIHRPGPSAVVAISRGFVLPVGLLLTFFSLLDGQAFGDRFSSWSFLAALPVAEWLTFALAVALCYRHRPEVLAVDSPERTVGLAPSMSPTSSG